MQAESDMIDGRLFADVVLMVCDGRVSPTALRAASATLGTLSNLAHDLARRVELDAQGVSDDAHHHLMRARFAVRMLPAELQRLLRKPGCTGISARWCPRCGDCACPAEDAEMGNLNHPDCPLHAPACKHGEYRDDA